jgi:aminopeptidase YwaD
VLRLLAFDEVSMFRSIKDQLSNTISGVAAKGFVADISRYHRIQASPEFRQAAEMIYETLLGWGLEAQLLSYPANESTRFWGMRMFQEWTGITGTLRLVAPADEARILADMREVRLSLIPRSAPFEGKVTVIIPRNKGEEPQDYEGLDVAGKVVITNGQVMRVHRLAVEERGAVGLIFDGMRTLDPVSPLWSLPDAIQYTSFWWWNTPRQGFGFALTPRQGDWLRRLVEQASADEPVEVHARVASRLYDGTIENVTATIPGATEDEILLVSHLCHPTPCANDNASGAAATLEVAHALHTLITAGDLPRPRRTLRFLWMPEMTGTYAYLNHYASHDSLSRMIAGLNLDMVGEDQERCGSAMLIDSPPEASASFAVDLLEHIREELFDGAKSFSKRGQIPLFRYATVPFSGGSDHYIFSDPTVGVPMPMLIQWPDRFYHTTADTLDKVSPETLARSCLLAATYTYWLGMAGPQEVEWLAREMSARFKCRIITLLQDAVTANPAQSAQADSEGTGLSWQRRIEYWTERQQRAFESLRRLYSDFDPQPWSRATADFASGEWAATRDLLPINAGPEHHTEASQEADIDGRAGRVPRRLFPGPVWEQTLLRYHAPPLTEKLYALQKRHKELPRILPTLSLYWVDGQRTVAEIVDRVELETGVRAPDLIADYFDILAELEAIAW